MKRPKTTVLPFAMGLTILAVAYQVFAAGMLKSSTKTFTVALKNSSGQNIKVMYSVDVNRGQTYTDLLASAQSRVDGLAIPLSSKKILLHGSVLAVPSGKPLGQCVALIGTEASSSPNVSIDVRPLGDDRLICVLQYDEA